MANSVQFKTRDAVDFVIIGSGSAGGILAKELSTSGFDVVVLEQGPYRKASDFSHDELSVVFQAELRGGGQEVHAQTFRHDESAQDDFLRSQDQGDFFAMAREMTIFGFFAMSSYGGNKDHVGWDLIDFEGHHGAWTYPFGHYDTEQAMENSHGE
jgi:choline dehydrogenase-like flavoprotein